MCTKLSSLSCHSACLSMPFSPSHMSTYTTNNQRHIQTNYQNAHALLPCGDIGRGLVKWNNSYNLREFGIREIPYANYRVAVSLLVGQGWEQRRPTLPKLCVSKARPKVLIFLRLNYLFGVNQWLKTKSFVNSICPYIHLSTGQQLR